MSECKLSKETQEALTKAVGGWFSGKPLAVSYVMRSDRWRVVSEGGGMQFQGSGFEQYRKLFARAAAETHDYDERSDDWHDDDISQAHRRWVEGRRDMREAMGQMANVMWGVYRTLTGVRWALEGIRGEGERRSRDLWLCLADFSVDERREFLRRAPEEWSARVRAKVAALPKPGPVVACQGDWEED